MSQADFALEMTLIEVLCIPEAAPNKSSLLLSLATHVYWPAAVSDKSLMAAVYCPSSEGTSYRKPEYTVDMNDSCQTPHIHSEVIAQII